MSSMPLWRHFIDGKLVDSKDHYDVHNPYDGEKIATGAVTVGDTGVFRADTYPFGGMKGSGLGPEGIRWAMEAMTEPRMLVLNLPRRK
jgi:acyl-CoA reductase-like NAD-dependent aldehyde dehydrogenase